MTYVRVVPLLVVVIWVALLVSGRLVLVSEAKVPPGEPVPASFGTDWAGSTAAAPQLACTYFDGRSLRRRVFWYSTNGVMGRDACPTLLPN